MMDQRMDSFRALAAKYAVELAATTPEAAAEELYRRVPALRRQHAAPKRDFHPLEPGEVEIGPGNESAWDTGTRDPLIRRHR